MGTVEPCNTKQVQAVAESVQFCDRLLVRTRALVRGGWSGLMPGIANRIGPPINNHCIRHGPLMLMPGHAFDLNSTLAQLGLQPKRV